MHQKIISYAMLFLLLLIVLSCSRVADPKAEVTAANPTPEITASGSAGSTATIPLPTVSPAPSSTRTPLLTATSTPAPASGPTLTPTTIPTVPPPLPLRDDLPALTLKEFPRPPADNGLGIHFIASGYYDDAELDKQIARIQSLHLKWALVLYADENFLEKAATKFKAAGVAVVWRKTLRPFERYSGWGRDIDILNRVGMPPYMQLYNEPELPAEWEGQTPNPTVFMANLLQAAKDVYNAGGYPGMQFLDEETLRSFIDQIYARKGEALFHRMFFVAHSYGLNHPPDYVEDTNGVLGFRTLARILLLRLGFIPPVIVGEGGWKVGSSEDTRFPVVDETLHRDYTLAVFNWFRTGKMSNGSPLPDYVFAFCMWMISGQMEAGAWYDAFNGDRTLTIQGVQQIPKFVRKFSWGN